MSGYQQIASEVRDFHKMSCYITNLLIICESSCLLHFYYPRYHDIWIYHFHLLLGGWKNQWNRNALLSISYGSRAVQQLKLWDAYIMASVMRLWEEPLSLNGWKGSKQGDNDWRAINAVGAPKRWKPEVIEGLCLTVREVADATGISKTLTHRTWLLFRVNSILSSH